MAVTVRLGRLLRVRVSSRRIRVGFRRATVRVPSASVRVSSVVVEEEEPDNVGNESGGSDRDNQLGIRHLCIKRIERHSIKVRRYQRRELGAGKRERELVLYQYS